MTKKVQILPCPHCGTRAEQKILCTAYGTEEIWLGPEPDHNYDVETYTFFVQCTACNEVSVYADWAEGDQPGNLKSAARLFPATRELTGIPKAIQEIYNEANKVKKISPTAFAVLIRKGLEYLCKEQKASGTNLKEQLDDLAKQGIIPATLSRMTQALRYLGNLGAHSEIGVGIEEAGVIDDFFVATLEYVYVAPEKLNKLLVRLKNKDLPK